MGTANILHSRGAGLQPLYKTEKACAWGGVPKKSPEGANAGV